MQKFRAYAYVQPVALKIKTEKDVKNALNIKQEMPSRLEIENENYRKQSVKSVQMGSAFHDTQNKIGFLTSEKQALIAEIVALKTKHQQTYFELKRENESIQTKAKINENMLKNQVDDLMKERDNIKIEALQWKNKLKREVDQNNEQKKIIAKLRQDNKILSAQTKQIGIKIGQHDKRESTTATKLKRKHETSAQTYESDNDDVYDVEKLLNDKQKGKKRYFLVRWKGYDDKHDSWESESNLNCPNILEDYLKQKRNN